RFQQLNRQCDITFLLNAELKNWLFAPDGGTSQALIQFTVDGDRVRFPDSGLSVASDGATKPVPVGGPATEAPSKREIEEVYYPRIQFSLHDLRVNQNPGAQYFRRLNSMIVQIPG